MVIFLRLLTCLLLFTTTYHPMVAALEDNTQTANDYNAQRLENAFGGHFLRIKKQTSSHKAMEILGEERTELEKFDSLANPILCTVLLFLFVPQFTRNAILLTEWHAPKAFPPLFIALRNLRI
ncbi:hypothetical protein [Parapedobacter koreensis]|uniref:Uncharacterized protein n=1 Tax=Parapedobacter koreensis TaxID=332977 RepID=A0A1H7FJR0_9SPHI|nr:hypothetical protein [Parapedobacter koreensis]SEK26198.1 hypothetical protein SAMN05421740_101374 [Parapedobacter koreensis]